jgi:hypothetical protein
MFNNDRSDVSFCFLNLTRKFWNDPTSRNLSKELPFYRLLFSAVVHLPVASDFIASPPAARSPQTPFMCPRLLEYTKRAIELSNHYQKLFNHSLKKSQAEFLGGQHIYSFCRYQLLKYRWDWKSIGLGWMCTDVDFTSSFICCGYNFLYYDVGILHKLPLSKVNDIHFSEINTSPDFARKAKKCHADYLLYFT